MHSNSKSSKAKFYHKLINNEVIYDNKAIDRYKKNNAGSKSSSINKKLIELDALKEKIKAIKNCDLKKNATNLVFSDGNPFSKIMLILIVLKQRHIDSFLFS